jgi:curved DNA-binding protein CbpA
MAELKQGRRIQAQKWHPDRNRDPLSQQRMAAINNAYKTLIDPDKRREYDESILSAWQKGAPAKTAAATPQPWVPDNGSLRQVPSDSPHETPAHGTVTSAAYLCDKGFKVVDNRKTGGVLWVVAKPGLEPVLDGLRQQGMDFEFAPSGGMATNNRAAWFTRSWG